ARQPASSTATDCRRELLTAHAGPDGPATATDGRGTVGPGQAARGDDGPRQGRPGGTRLPMCTVSPATLEVACSCALPAAGSGNRHSALGSFGGLIQDRAAFGFGFRPAQREMLQPVDQCRLGFRFGRDAGLDCRRLSYGSRTLSPVPAAIFLEQE